MKRPRLAACLVALAVVDSAGAAASSRPVPRPPTAAMEPAVREQIAAIERALDGALDTPGVPAAEGLATFADCGLTYAAYGFVESALACFENAALAAPDDARWPYYLGVLRQDDGEFAAAAADFERARELRPGDPAILLRLGDVLLQLGALERAESVFAAALEVRGAVAGAQYGLGRIALERARVDEAISHFEAALARQPGASIVRYALGQAYRRAGRVEDARRELAAHGADEVRFPDPWMGELGGRNRGSQQLVKLGSEALEARRFDVAVEVFERALESRPEDSSSWTKLGVAHEGLGALAAAERCYRQAIATAPENARAHYNLGTLLARTGRLGESLEPLETAARLAPDAPAMAFNLARALGESGEHERALAVYDRLLERMPSDTEARFARAQTLAALGLHAEAATELAAVVAAAPGELAPRLAEARALLNAGRAGEARERLGAALARFPDSDEITFLLVRILTTVSDPRVRDGARAQELVGRLAAAPADREEAQALTLAELGRVTEAATHARQALALTPPADAAVGRRRSCLAELARGEPCRTVTGAW